MATLKGIEKLKTMFGSRGVSNFYGSPIKKGLLHKKLGIPQGQKIPISLLKDRLSKLKKKKNKTAQDVKKEREIVFALNSKTKFRK